MSALYAVVGGILLSAAASDFVRVLQHCGYRAREYVRGLAFADIAVALGAALVGSLAALGAELLWGRPMGLCGAAVGVVTAFAAVLLRRHTAPVRPTARCLRLYAALALLDALTLWPLLYFVARGAASAGWTALWIAAQAPFAPVSEWLLLPYENARRKTYLQRARARLSACRPTVVGITGSFAKTGVKSILATLLSVRYRVCATPGSYNTPMGVALTINRDLKETDEIFLVEMGARYAGDIAELCALTGPDVGVITGIGNQHLATFGSKAVLMDTKYELVRGLKEGGAAFFAADEGSFALYRRGYMPAFTPRVAGKYTIVFSDVTTDCGGSSFRMRRDGVTVCASTALIGEHNVANIRLAAMVALYFGLTLREIAEGIARLKPVPHRLQLLPRVGGTQVIDDSYNGSLEGIGAAMKTLALFASPRVVITPGVVEGGNEGYATNYRCGMAIGGVADYAFVYGANASALTEGALCAGMRRDRVRVVRSRERAVSALSALPNGAGTVIFCNDLPV